ncbi:hypothetical protein MA16_Dca023621 [Dendrobium catenatum]|uniref:Uncharacterized protein n=1 Tax=Dendrobium catenatum TaxID=906689 RepID=A0A2I0W2B7_9ASPA|nr:hypothetical protein MA16_Dca023621 [Dendrobium catenatum]
MNSYSSHDTGPVDVITSKPHPFYFLILDTNIFIEVISLKETQLIGNVTLFPEINKGDSGQEIRIISPKNIIDKDEKTTDIYDFEHTKPCDEEGTETLKQETKLSFDQELQNCEEDVIGTQGSGSMMSDLRAISSYEEFLEHIDGQLRQAELDICNFLRLSTMIWESKQKKMNLKVQHISDILDHVRSTRER